MIAVAEKALIPDPLQAVLFHWKTAEECYNDRSVPVEKHSLSFVGFRVPRVRTYDVPLCILSISMTYSIRQNRTNDIERLVVRTTPFLSRDVATFSIGYPFV